MQKLFSRHNICLLLPVLLRKGNDYKQMITKMAFCTQGSQNSWLFLRAHFLFSSLCLLHSLQILMLLPTFMSFHSADSFQHPFICLFNHTILHRLWLLTAPLFVFFSTQFHPSHVLVVFSSSTCFLPSPASQMTSCMAYQDSKEAERMPYGKEAVTALTPGALQRMFPSCTARIVEKLYNVLERHYGHT